MHNNEIKDKFIELRLKGQSLAKISEAIGVSKTTLVTWNRECQQQLRELRSAELEVLHDRVLQTYETDLERLQRFQRGIDTYLNDIQVNFIFTMENVIEYDQLIRNQMREIRKDIELFGRITDDAKNLTPPFPKSETTNTESLKSEISNSNLSETPSENLTVS